ILPEQALIFMNARMHLPLKDAWWNSMVNKLKAHSPTIQDESSLSALTQCVRDNQCNLPKRRMMEAFLAALSHPGPSARLLATYGDYAWNVMNDHVLGERMIREAVKTSPSEPAYQITLIRMLAVQGRDEEAEQALQQLTTLNIGGRLDRDLPPCVPCPGCIEHGRHPRGAGISFLAQPSILALWPSGHRTSQVPMKAVILAGGLGTRISEETTVRPKPMIDIGGKPVLWHILKIYSQHGINDFIICLGYKGYMVKEYFANYFLHT